VTVTDKEKIDITDEDMRIDTRRQGFDIRQIRNRRFMFSPQTGTLILGRQHRRDAVTESHAEEHGRTAKDEPFDSFVRGWVGMDGGYTDGVIHFAPPIPKDSPEMFSNGYSALEMLASNGASKTTVIRGFSGAWEQPLSDIIDIRKLTEKRKENTDMSEATTATAAPAPIVLTADNARDKLKEITDRLEA
jgi:hypothetical protein